jgi:Leucine-rich repeat (LRR) protein
MTQELSLNFPAKPSLGNLYTCEQGYPHKRSWLGQAQGTVQVHVPAGNLVGLAFASTTLAKHITEHKAAIASMASADLSTTTLNAGLAQALFECSKLIEIRLDFLPLAGDVLTEFAGGRGLSDLVTLSLTGTTISDNDLKAFQNLQSIAHLAVKSTPITNAAMAILANFGHLTHLQLPKQISDEGLALISRSKSLLSLDLSYSSISDAGLASLKNMPQLETLYVNDTTVGDAGLAHLSGHPGLKVLFLNGTRVTDRGLDELAAVPNLSHLDLRDTTATEIGAARLRSKLKDCAIFGP